MTRNGRNGFVLWFLLYTVAAVSDCGTRGQGRDHPSTRPGLWSVLGFPSLLSVLWGHLAFSAFAGSC